MPRRVSESRISSTAGATSAPSTALRRGRSRSPRRDRRLLHDCSDRSSDGSERSGRDRRRRRRRKSRGRSRSKRHRRHRRRSRDTDSSSSESDSDDDSDTSYESDGSRDRRKRSKSHKSSKRSSSRKSTSRKGGSRRKRSKRSDCEDSGTQERATASTKGGNMAKHGAIARFVRVQHGERVPRRGEVGMSSADEFRHDDGGGNVTSGSRHARKENQVYSAREKRAPADSIHGEKARQPEGKVREGVGRLVDREIGNGTDDAENKHEPVSKTRSLPSNYLRGIHES